MEKNAKARRKHSAAFKAKVALDALKERETLSELGAKYNLSPVQIGQWKKQLLEHSTSAFESGTKKGAADETESLLQTLYQKIGQYQVELDWLKKRYGAQP